jgi:imidazolonepropionase-like amidohydrolase
VGIGCRLNNDYDNPGAEGGMPLGEMQLLAEAGLTPMEIIQAATKYAAVACGHGEELGTLEPRKLADVIVVEGNPLTDLAALVRLKAVILDGQLIDLER